MLFWGILFAICSRFCSQDAIDFQKEFRAYERISKQPQIVFRGNPALRPQILALICGRHKPAGTSIRRSQPIY
jgi:hypothetical protein